MDVEFRNARGLRLAGTLYRADSHAVVVMAHGFMSDRHSSGRFDQIATRLAQAGYDAFAFDFSGCGESEDDSLTAAKQVDDLRSAIAHARSLGYERIALWGNSLGCRICVSAYKPGIATMVLTGAGPGPVQYRWEEHFSAAQLRELEETGRLTERLDEGPRRTVVVEAQMLRDFAEFDQAAILGRIECPVLLINGDGDAEERMLSGVSAAAMRFLPEGSRHTIIPGAAHGFWGHLDTVADLGVEWLERHVPTKGGDA
jgi:pimeloyl-ACP methyl ester carboxylesterase